MKGKPQSTKNPSFCLARVNEEQTVSKFRKRAKIQVAISLCVKRVSTQNNNIMEITFIYILLNMTCLYKSALAEPRIYCGLTESEFVVNELYNWYSANGLKMSKKSNDIQQFLKVSKPIKNIQK